MAAAAVIALPILFWLNLERGAPHAQLFEANQRLAQSEGEGSILRTQVSDLGAQVAAGKDLIFKLERALKEVRGVASNVLEDSESLRFLTEGLGTPLGQVQVYSLLLHNASKLSTRYDLILDLRDEVFATFGNERENARNTVQANIVGYGGEGVTLFYKRLRAVFVATTPENILQVLVDNKVLLTAQNVDWRVVGAGYELWFNKCKYSPDSADCAPPLAAVQKVFNVESLSELQWVNIGRVYRLWLRAGQDGDALIKAGQVALLDLLSSRGL
jgi:hypothetical protein